MSRFFATPRRLPVPTWSLLITFAAIVDIWSTRKCSCFQHMMRRKKSRKGSTHDKIWAKISQCFSLNEIRSSKAQTLPNQHVWMCTKILPVDKCKQLFLYAIVRYFVQMLMLLFSSNPIKGQKSTCIVSPLSTLTLIYLTPNLATVYSYMKKEPHFKYT